MRSLARLQYHTDGARLGVRGVLTLAYRHQHHSNLLERRVVLVVVDSTAQLKVWVDNARGGQWITRLRLGDVIVVTSCACYFRAEQAGGSSAYVTPDSKLIVYRDGSFDENEIPQTCKSLMEWGKKEFPGHAEVNAMLDSCERMKNRPVVSGHSSEGVICGSIDAVVESKRDCTVETFVLVVQAWRRHGVFFVEVMDAATESTKRRCTCMVSPALADDMMLHDDLLLDALNAGICANAPFHIRAQFKVQLDYHNQVQIRQGILIHADLWAARS